VGGAPGVRWGLGGGNRLGETKRLATSRPRRIRHEIGQPMCNSAPTGPTPLTTVGSSPRNRHRLGGSGGCLRYPLGNDRIEVLNDC
jgi:hypothetical protein